MHVSSCEKGTGKLLVVGETSTEDLPQQVMADTEIICHCVSAFVICSEPSTVHTQCLTSSNLWGSTLQDVSLSYVHMNARCSSTWTSSCAQVLLCVSPLGKLLHFLVMGSKFETKVMAPAITTSRMLPAMTELSRFFSDGVTAASATRGCDIVAMAAAVTAAGTATGDWLWLLLLQTVNIV